MLSWVNFYTIDNRFKAMSERYDLTQLQEDLRRELGNGLTDEAVEAVKRLLFKYKSNPEDWQDKEKWSDFK